MKILVMNWRDAAHPQAGGAEVYIHENASRWVKQGHQVVLICAYHSSMPRSQDESNGVEIVRVGDRFRVYHAAMREYKRHWRDWPDIVVDSINGIPFFTPLYVEEPIVAVVYHIIGKIFFWEMPFPINLLGYGVERTMSIFYRNVPVVTISPSSRSELLRIGFPATHVSVVASGLDTPSSAPSVERNENLVLSVGRLKRYKRLDLLTKAARHVIEELPDAKFIVAGAGDYRGDLEYSIKAYGLEENFDLVGFIPEADKIDLLQRSKVLVMVSEKEGWGLTILEAASYGTPSIAFDAPGIRDAILNKKTGLLLDGRDPLTLSSAIVDLLTDEAQRRHLAEGALRFSREFSWDRTASSLLRLLEDRAFASAPPRAGP